MSNGTHRLEGKHIGFIGGGNMAGALVRGLLASGLVGAGQIRVSDVDPTKLADIGRAYAVQTTTDNDTVARDADVIVLAVKPQVVDRVLGPLSAALRRETLVVSIAAGIPIALLEGKLAPGMRVVRAMPNTAAIALASATAIAGGTHASTEDLDLAKEIFQAVGVCAVLEERLLDAVTGLSGSGPAYVMLVIEALADGGVKMGLPRDVALTLAAQTVFGAAKLQRETGEHPAKLKDMVTSPGGTTIAGLYALEAAGVRRGMIDAVESATRRSRELGSEIVSKL